MRMPKHDWPNTDNARGVLFFAQLMSEMLHNFSWDSYRAHALDTVHRIDELLRVGGDVHKEAIPLSALTPLIDELIWSLKTDPVCKTIIDFDIDDYTDRLAKEQTTLKQKARTAIFIASKISDKYKDACEAYISNNYNKNMRGDVKRATQLYCSHLINLGYDRKFIYNHVMEHFFFRKISRYSKSTITSFFKHFPGKAHKFDVLVKADKAFAKSASIVFRFKEADASNKLPPNLQLAPNNYLSINNKQRFIYFQSVKAMDEYSARDTIEFLLDSTKSLSMAVSSHTKSDWDKSVFIIRKRANSGKVLLAPDTPLTQQIRVPPNKFQSELKTLSNDILRDAFDETSSFRILRALNTSSTAYQTARKETQLISLWSAIEVLLTEPEKKNKSRIEHYIELLIPCIMHNYIKRSFVALFKDLKRHYGQSLFTILDKVSKEINGPKKLAEALCVNEHENLRKELCVLCAQNPLALHRMYELHNNLRTPAAILSFISDRDKTISWQLMRIYRARNTIVHAGEKPDFSYTLLMNLDEYIRRTLESVILAIKSDTKTPMLDQCIWNVGVAHKLHLSSLKKHKSKKNIDKSLFSELVWTKDL